MATLLLGVAGAAVGSAIGGTILGISAQAIGFAIGSTIGGAIDQQLFAPTLKSQGPRLKSVDITASTEGAAITRLYGRSRLAGQLIWATRFEEEVSTEESGGKGLGGGVTTTTFTYFGNFAVGFAEGPVTRIGRVWADGREVDQVEVTLRKYLGTETQTVDSLIEAKEGAGNAPPYRGLAYIVLEHFALETYGNRIPQITAEIFRAVGDLEAEIEGVSLIPGTTEFGYEPEEVTQSLGEGSTAVENRHSTQAGSDWEASLDLLGDLAPNCAAVNLVVAWFGDDLRCGDCTVRPKVENSTKSTTPHSWAVAGLTRSTANVVSIVDGRPAFGGSPNDASVIRAIQDLKTRGFAVAFYPFIMMDIEAGNTLPDPYSDNETGVGQSVYPWRGRITVSPAPGFAGTVDKTAAAQTQVDAFLGAALASHFSTSSGTTVTYTGPDEWSYRRFVLHMATLCDLAAQAGAPVDAFCIGSEMVALTQSRSSASAYPFVSGLIDLLGEVRTILGAGTDLGYAADWSEYHSHRPSDGSNDVFFNLDPLWADADCDFVGIDNYLPLTDWRDGTSHLDYDGANGPASTYEEAYLQGNIEGGEHYDFHYASDADRDAQTRTAIDDTDPADEDWVFRNKDIRNWWLNAHRNRPGGVRDVSPTAWAAESKPVWFTELGCPAIDKGANQPNVFVDPKSSESAFPYYSNGARDDAMQRAALAATLDYWALPANNPTSSVYSAPMIDLARIFIWAWDARSVPSFPDDEGAWADAPNWETGHWLSGRLGAAPASETIVQIFADYGFADYSVEAIGSVVDAIMIDRIMPARQVLETLAIVHPLDLVESEGAIKALFKLGRGSVASLTLEDIAAGDEARDRYSLRRAQETELPRSVKIVHGDPVNADQTAAAEARRLGTASSVTIDHQVAAVMAEAKARAAAEILLHEIWAGRETLSFGLPPSRLALDPGDVVSFTPTGDAYRLAEIADGEARRVEARGFEPLIFAPVPGPRRAGSSRASSVPAPLAVPASVFIDGALLRDADLDHAGYIAAFASPWPGSVAFWRSPTTSGYALDTLVPVAATMGVTAFDFFSGPAWRWDRGNTLSVALTGGALASASELAVLNGANVMAVENSAGEWEIVQFVTATLTATLAYDLTQLLRGQRGSEHAMPGAGEDPVPAGARVLVLDTAALRQTGISAGDVGLPLNWKIGPASRDISDPSYDTKAVTLTAKGRRPLSPARVDGVRPDGTDDIVLTWVRRTRIGGDSWDQTEVPLGEETEAYEVDILDAMDAVLRTFSASTPTITYTAAQQTADFGAPIAFPDELDLRIYQISAVFGRGVALEATLFFPLPVSV